MKKELRNIIFALLSLTFVNFGQTSDFGINSFDNEIITKEMIKSAGIINISDIINLSERLFFSSTNGFSHQLNIGGLNSYQTQNFDVFIDGQKIDIRVFDIQNLNHLPISVEQIDSVVIINQPALQSGKVSYNGVIHFYSKRYEKGLSLDIINTLGNETGDPGPYKFTDYSTANIDKLNYLINFGLGAVGEDWHLSTLYKSEDNFFTDSKIIDRINRSLIFGDYKSKSISGMVNFSFNLFERTQRVLGGFTEHNDFYFFRQFGSEIPVKEKLKHIGLNGSVPVKESLQFNYLFKFSEINIDKRENAKNLFFDFRTNNYYAVLGLTYYSRYFNSSFGFNYDETIAFSSGDIYNNKAKIFRLYGNVELKPTKRFIQNITASSAKLNKSFNYGLILNNKLELNAYNFLTSSFLLTQKNFNEELSLWDWIKRGYSSNVTDLLDYEYIPEYYSEKSFSADISLHGKYRNQLSYNLSGFFRSYHDFRIEDINYQYSIENSEFNTRIELIPNANILITGGRGGIKYYLSNSFDAGLFYAFQRPLDGSRVPTELWAYFPEHSANLILNFKPVENFGIWARVRFLSSTQWYEYRYVDYQSKEFYQREISDKLLVDLAFQKWFWERKIWTSVSFRNLTNSAEIYHPIGAELSFRFLVQIHFYLNSILK